MLGLLSRRKFFGLFGGAAAAAAVPKPLMAMAPPEVTSFTTPVVSFTSSGFRKQTIYKYVQFMGNHPPDGFRPGAVAYYCGNGRVSLNPQGRNHSMRVPVGLMVSPIDPGHYGWIQVDKY